MKCGTKFAESTTVSGIQKQVFSFAHWIGLPRISSLSAETSNGFGNRLSFRNRFSNCRMHLRMSNLQELAEFTHLGFRVSYNELNNFCYKYLLVNSAKS